MKEEEGEVNVEGERNLRGGREEDRGKWGSRKKEIKYG